MVAVQAKPWASRGGRVCAHQPVFQAIEVRVAVGTFARPRSRPDGLRRQIRGGERLVIGQMGGDELLLLALRSSCWRASLSVVFCCCSASWAFSTCRMLHSVPDPASSSATSTNHWNLRAGKAAAS